MNRDRPSDSSGDTGRYGPTLDALPDPAWVTGPDGAVEYLNVASRGFFGLPLDDLLGWDWGWTVHPNDLPRVLSGWGAALRAEIPHAVELRLRRHDGEYLWFLARSAPLRDRDGNVLRWFGLCTDIDRLKHAEEQLRTNRVLVRALVERGEDGFALVAPDGTVRYASPTLCVLLGFTADELAGTDAWGSVHPEDRVAVSEWLDGLVENPGGRSALSVRFLHRDGGSRRLDVRGTNLLPDPDVRALAIQFRATEPEPGGPLGR